MELSRAWLSVMSTAVCAEPAAEYAYCLSSYLSWQCHVLSLFSPRWSIWQRSKRIWYQVFQPPVSLMCRRLVLSCKPPESKNICSKYICPLQVLAGAQMLVCCNGPPVRPRRQVCYLFLACVQNKCLYSVKALSNNVSPDLPATLMEKYSAAAGNHSKKPEARWNQNFHVFILSPFFFGLIRFQLLKEFLLADEMHPSCITEPLIERQHRIIVHRAAVLGELCRSRAQLLRTFPGILDWPL